MRRRSRSGSWPWGASAAGPACRRGLTVPDTIGGLYASVRLHPLGKPERTSANGSRPLVLRTWRSPTKTAYRFLGMAPPWTPTRRGNARLIQSPRSYPTSSSGAKTESSTSSESSWACRRRRAMFGSSWSRPSPRSGGVDRDGGRRLHLDPGPTTALLEPGTPGAAGDEGNPANRTGRGPRDPHRGGLPGRRSRGDRGADLPQPHRGARIHDVLRTPAVSRRGERSEGERRPPRDRDRRGALHPPEPVLLRRE